MADEKAKQAAEAIENAWVFWLSQHDVSVPETIEAAVQKAFSRWLNENKGEIIAAIAKNSR